MRLIKHPFQNFIVAMTIIGTIHTVQVAMPVLRWIGFGAAWLGQVVIWPAMVMVAEAVCGRFGSECEGALNIVTLWWILAGVAAIGFFALWALCCGIARIFSKGPK